MFIECIHTTDVLPKKPHFRLECCKSIRNMFQLQFIFFGIKLFLQLFVFSDPPLTARSKKRFEILLLNK